MARSKYLGSTCRWLAWDIGLLLGEEKKVQNPFVRAEHLGFDSATSYVRVHHIDVRDCDLCDYKVMQDRYFEMYESVRDACRQAVRRA